MSEATRTIVTAADFTAVAATEADPYPSRRRLLGIKRCFDIQIALGAIVFLLPLILTVALLLLVTQGRPIFIRHRRIGRGGIYFPCLKFRTMVRNADRVLQEFLDTDPEMRAEWRETRKLRVDPRVTALGRVLRQSSVDELPQLFNVLRGDMSLVGPRPIVAEEIEVYGPKIQHYYRVRPGLTGAWQVGGRSEVAFTRRVELDSAYVTGWTLGTDIKILFKTVPVVLKRKGSF